MRSNYKRLGDYIHEVNIRNVELKATTLLGINIDKFYMPSVANIVGTDMTTYKIVKNGQFACNRMHVGRDYRLPVALSKSSEVFTVSPAYDVFEVLDTEVLLPEYLMMWFSRKEYDRNAWFYTDADVRGGLNWKAFCDMQLPVPNFDKQKQIVKEYNKLVNRIALKNQLIQKLEETALAIYRQWFVDYEFPDEEGKSYKSNGGEMGESELGEIPKGWEVGVLIEMIEIKYGKAYSHLEKGNIPLYGSGGVMGYVNKVLYDKPTILIPRKGSLNNILYLNKPFWSVDTMFYSILKKEYNGCYVYYYLIAMDFNSLNVGSAVPSMTTNYLNNMLIIKPSECVLKKFDKLVRNLFNQIEFKKMQNEKLKELQDLLLSKLVTIEN